VIIDAPNESGGCMEDREGKITVLKILIGRRCASGQSLPLKKKPGMCTGALAPKFLIFKKTDGCLIFF